jgi:hypothetical protein
MGIAFRVDGAEYADLESETEDKVIVCAHCFDVAEGAEALEEDDVFFSVEGLQRNDEATVCYSCEEPIESGDNVWNVIHERAQVHDRDENGELANQEVAEGKS